MNDDDTGFLFHFYSQLRNTSLPSRLLLLLLLSRISHVRLCATPETAAHQAPPSLDSPGKNTGVGCHFLLQCMKVKSEREIALSDPMDCSLPGSSIPGILQARTVEWVAISFSSAWKWKVKVKSLSHVWLLATPWTAAYQAPPSLGFSRQEYWSGVPLPSPNSDNSMEEKIWPGSIIGQMEASNFKLNI